MARPVSLVHKEVVSSNTMYKVAHQLVMRPKMLRKLEEMFPDDSPIMEADLNAFIKQNKGKIYHNDLYDAETGEIIPARTYMAYNATTGEIAQRPSSIEYCTKNKLQSPCLPDGTNLYSNLYDTVIGSRVTFHQQDGSIHTMQHHHRGKKDCPHNAQGQWLVTEATESPLPSYMVYHPGKLQPYAVSYHSQKNRLTGEYFIREARAGFDDITTDRRFESDLRVMTKPNLLDVTQKGRAKKMRRWVNTNRRARKHCIN